MRTWLIQTEEGAEEKRMSLEEIAALRVPKKCSAWFRRQLEFTIYEARRELRGKPVEIDWDAVHQWHRTTGAHIGHSGGPFASGYRP